MTWASKKQLVFLNARLPAYLEHQAKGTTPKFWSPTMDEWYAVWPDKKDAKTGKSFVSRIHEWYNNHTRGHKSSAMSSTLPVAPATTSGGRRSRRVLNLGGRRGRKLSVIQVYIVAYYNVKLKAVVDEEFAKYKAEAHDEGEEKTRIQFMYDVCSDMYENESAEVKSEVEGIWLEQDAEDEEAFNDDGKPVKEGVLKEWDENIKALPLTLVTFLRELYVQTGFVGMVGVGGCIPGDNGNIVTMILNSEVVNNKPTFQAFHKNYNTEVVGPWEEYINSLFPPEERARRSLLSGLEAMGGTDIDMSTSGGATSPDDRVTSTATASKKAEPEVEDEAPAPAPPPAYPVAAAIMAEYGKHRAENLARNAQLLKDLNITSEVEALTAGFMKPTPRRRGPNKPKEASTEVRRSGRLTKESAGAGVSKDTTAVDNEEPIIEPTPTTVQSSGVVDSSSPSPDSSSAVDLSTPLQPSSSTTTPADPSSTPPVLADISTSASSKLPSEPNTTASQRLSVPAVDNSKSPSDAPLPAQQTAPESTEYPARTTTSVSADSPMATQEPTPDQITPSPDTVMPVEPSDASNSFDGATDKTIRTPISEVPALTPPALTPPDQNATFKEAPGISVASAPDVEVSPTVGSSPSCPEAPSTIESSPSSLDPNDSPPNVPAAVTMKARNPFAAVGQPLPQWIVELREFVVEHVNSKEMQACLGLLERFERGLGFARSEEKSNWLTTENRPTSIKYWIGRGRSYDLIPPYDDTYPDRWRGWWTGMQPAWRKESGWPMAREIHEDEQWKELAKGGKNGFSLAIVALIWWAAKTTVDEGKGSLDEFRSALEDVNWVLGEMVRNLEEGDGIVEGLARRGQSKHALEDDEGDVSGGKKRRGGRKVVRKVAA